MRDSVSKTESGSEFSEKMLGSIFFWEKNDPATTKMPHIDSQSHVLASISSLSRGSNLGIVDVIKRLKVLKIYV